jgi:hypothetical protein
VYACEVVKMLTMTRLIEWRPRGLWIRQKSRGAVQDSQYAVQYHAYISVLS